MNYGLIREMDICNGLGIRCTLFVSGCMRHCKNCYNQQLWDFKYGKEFTKETYNSIVEILKQPHIAGLSLLGGEILDQGRDNIEILKNLCKVAHELNKNVWCWTGYTWEEFPKLQEYQRELIRSCDVLVDGAYIDELKDLSLAFRGSSNQRIINVKESLEQNKIVQLNLD